MKTTIYSMRTIGIALLSVAGTAVAAILPAHEADAQTTIPTQMVLTFEVPLTSGTNASGATSLYPEDGNEITAQFTIDGYELAENTGHGDPGYYVTQDNVTAFQITAGALTLANTTPVNAFWNSYVFPSSDNPLFLNVFVNSDNQVTSYVFEGFGPSEEEFISYENSNTPSSATNMAGAVESDDSNFQGNVSNGIVDTSTVTVVSEPSRLTLVGLGIMGGLALLVGHKRKALAYNND